MNNTEWRSLLNEGKKLIGESKEFEWIEPFAKKIESTIKSIFPKSHVEVLIKSPLGDFEIYITFAIGNKSDWNNGLVQNDPMYLQINIDGFNDNGSIPSKLYYQVFTGGSLHVKPDESEPRHLRKAYGSVKVIKRAKAYGPANKVLQKLEKDFKDIKTAIKSNLNNMMPHNQYVKNYI